MMRWLAIVALVVAVAAGMVTTRPAPRAGIAPQVSKAHATLASLTAGDLLVLAIDFDPASVPELAPFVRLTLDIALMRGARVVTLSLSPHGAMLAERYLREALADRKATYGRDAINLGFIEGRSTAVHLTGIPLQRMTSRDHSGTALGDLPLAGEIPRLSDASSFVVASSGTSAAFDWLLQGQGRFTHDLVVATSSSEGPELAAFEASGQLAGLVAGARDVAAFADIAANDPRLHADPGTVAYLRDLATQMRAQRWTHLALVLCFVAGQGVTLWRGRKKGTP